jgi:hypothetical protein
MNKFDQVYQSIISEAKFGNKKWREKERIEDIQVFENYLHLKDRLKERYKIEFDDWIMWNLFKYTIIFKFIEFDLWSKCSKKDPYQRGFTVHLTISNMWLSGIIQNDIEDGEKRIYFSTFLPEEPIFNKHDIKLDIPL